MIYYLTAQQAVAWIIRFLAIYIIIDSAEKLSVHTQFKQGGLFDWETIKQNGYFKNRSAMPLQLVNAIFSYPGWMLLIAIRGWAGLMLIIAPDNSVLTKIMLLAVFITSSLINLRNKPLGAETENRFALMITGALLLRYFVSTPVTTVACLWFIALQSCLSYVTAGAAKLFYADWRNGNGILNVFDSPSLVPTKNVAHWLNKHNKFAKLLTWGTLSIECAFPLALFGQPLLWLFLGWGVLFHAAIAIFIRLGKFFWIWIATYPAIIFVAH